MNRIKAAARANGADIIDLGMGNPDLDAPKHVIAKLCETAGRPRTDRYSASKGIAGLRRAQAGYYERRFGVKLNPDTQVVATLGSKEGFANMAQAITAPGDVVLVPNPSYPIHAFGFLMAGGVIRSVPAEPTPAMFPALERAMQHSIPKPVALVVCYPSNPTAYVAGLDFYKDLVAFAKKHELILLSDLAYAEVYFDGEPPPSVLQVPGAIDCTVEFTSLSKTYSMAGWRMGFAVGNERLLAALTRVKSYLDYGAFTPIQVAATAAINGPDDCIHEMRAVYKKRREALVDSFGKAGGRSGPGRVDVRLGADPRAVPLHGQPGILQAPPGKVGRGGRPRHRLRRARRRLRPHRHGRERAAHPSGRAQPAPVLRRGGQVPAQRRADRAGGLSPHESCGHPATGLAKGLFSLAAALVRRRLPAQGPCGGIPSRSRELHAPSVHHRRPAARRRCLGLRAQSHHRAGSRSGPRPTDAYACQSRPLPLNAFTTGCRPVPTSPPVVLQSRG